ncbi:hypothetical protein TIFTF001_009181 [Ficus carica]|uniref:Uncharacterized protein n=1 Tax=Ficus carica TaxID=3494 RepID=A0AA87ZMN8_FICCA|nr:hypothetical protein TIFTF001_009181 [Ficus carica]
MTTDVGQRDGSSRARPKRAAIRERNQGGNKSFGGWKLQQLWGGFAAAWWPNLGLGKQQELDFNPPFQPAVVKEEKGEERAAKLLVVRKVSNCQQLLMQDGEVRLGGL